MVAEVGLEGAVVTDVVALEIAAVFEIQDFPWAALLRLGPR